MSEHETRTRQIYEAQHKLISADETATARIVGTYEQTTFGVDPQWFKGKSALDAGCGNIGAMILKLHGLGSKVHAIDLGSDWIEPLTENLTKAGLPSSAYSLQPGSVLDIPFADQEFDFVSINGVLIHLETMADIEKGFAEGARVTRKDGHYFTSYGPCGGVMQGVVMPALRAHYRADVGFRMLIDNLSPSRIHTTIDKIVADARIYAGQTLDAEFLKGLFGWDYCVFLQNYIQAPTWWSNECTPAFVEELYRRHGFADVKRLHNYNKRSDIRKFFAPLHYDRDHPISKVLYGEGYVQYVGRRL
jgi:ubiquinone/menaquinone biosynthesis C-methylase UbiE